MGRKKHTRVTKYTLDFPINRHNVQELNLFWHIMPSLQGCVYSYIQTGTGAFRQMYWEYSIFYYYSVSFLSFISKKLLATLAVVLSIFQVVLHSVPDSLANGAIHKSESLTTPGGKHSWLISIILTQTVLRKNLKMSLYFSIIYQQLDGIGISKHHIRHESVLSLSCLLQIWPHKDSGPRLNIKTVLSTYGDFHVKDKTAVRTSYL